MWERTWYSNSERRGPLGYGWHHSYDLALWPDPETGTVALRLEDGRLVLFEALSAANEQCSYYRARQLELRPAPDGSDGYAVYDVSVRRTSHFAPDPAQPGQYRLTVVEDGYGHAVALAYTPGGHLAGLTDSVGRTIGVRTDAAGRILALDLPQPDGTAGTFAAVQYAYDEAGHLTSVTNAEGHTRHFGYEGDRLVRKSFATGISFYYEYDAQGRCTRTWGDENYYNGRLVYEPNQTTLYTDEPQAVDVYYHEQGLVTTHINPLGHAQHWRYNQHLELEEEQDALGQTTRYTYDGRGNRTGVTYPDGGQVQMQYNQFDQPAQVTDANGHGWQWQYDERGELTERTDPLGGNTGYSYDAWGQLVEIRDALGHATRLRYDAQGNLAHIVAPNNAIRSRAYDALGRLVALTDASGHQQHRRYDRRGQMVTKQEADGQLTELTYDGEGNVARARNGTQEVEFEYTAVNRLAVRRQAGQQMQFAYDRETRLVSLTNEHGRRYRFELDAAGQVVEEEGFDGLVRRYARDAAGQVITMQRPGERSTAYAYDAAGRLVAVAHDEEAPTTYRYDAAGALLEVATAVTSVRLERDALGRVVREQQGEHTVTHAHDLRSQRTSLISSLGAAFTWQHDVLGDLDAVQAGANWQAQLRHDSGGLEVQRQLSGGLRLDWQRDAAGRPTSQRVAVGGQPVRQRRYQWEGTDQLAAIEDSGSGTTRYAYDAASALTGARYTDGDEDVRLLDAVGNLFRSPALDDRQYAPGGQLRQAGGTRYKYDEEGNLIQKTNQAGQTWHYQWNGGGQLVNVALPNGYTVSFAYDGLGRRVSKRYRGRVTKWVWDGDVPLHEWTELEVGPGKSAADNLTTWLFEEGSFAPAAKLTAQGAYSVVADHLGTPFALYDERGQPVWEMQLDSYGQVRQGKGQAQDCPFRYQGQYEDIETGLYYNRFRYYDPEAGQYISQDPLGLLGGGMFYAYVSNPNFQVDSLGLIDEFGIAPYKSSAHANDNFTAHELLQNAWLRNNGKVSGREGGIARQNPAIALSESPMHKNIGDMQRAGGLHDPQVLGGQSAMKNINQNSVITKQGIATELVRRGWTPENARAFAHERVLTLRRAAIQFATDNNLLTTNCP